MVIGCILTSIVSHRTWVDDQPDTVFTEMWLLESLASFFANTIIPCLLRMPWLTCSTIVENLHAYRRTSNVRHDLCRKWASVWWNMLHVMIVEDWGEGSLESTECECGQKWKQCESIYIIPIIPQLTALYSSDLSRYQEKSGIKIVRPAW